MSLRISDLQCKEVICISDGRRLGFVSDVQVELPGGQVCAIIVPCPCKPLAFPGRNDEFIIPWRYIKKIGSDIVLVDIRPEDCRFPKPKRPWLL